MSVTSGEPNRPSYFLVSVSTRENLELCIRYALAGFPSGESGAWTFCEITRGDFVSFLYGATAYNLYRVADQRALAKAEQLPPWKLLEFRETGRIYSFPFRLHLQPLRIFSESLVRAEFSYVGQNLLLRGGYRKTHFQADQTTLQSVSEMGTRADSAADALVLPRHATFTLRFTRTTELAKPPETCRFKEQILQSAIRRHLTRSENLRAFASALGLPFERVDGLEVLGEKALPQGHVDLLIKERAPLGSVVKVPIEVKMNRAGMSDLNQLRSYMAELRGDCSAGVLIASDFGKGITPKAAATGIRLVRYRLNCDLKSTPSFEDISSSLTLHLVGD
jgi:hypothetical protein